MTGIQPYQFEQEEALQDEDDSDCFEEGGIIEETVRRTRNTNWCPCELCVLLAQVKSEHLTFLLPALKSGIWCSHNGGPPVIWIISLYLYLVFYISGIVCDYYCEIFVYCYNHDIFK